MRIICRSVLKIISLLISFSYLANIHGKATVITQTLENVNEDPIVALLSDQQDTYETNGSTNIYQEDSVHQSKSLAEMEILIEESESRNALMRNDTRRWRMIDPNDGRVIIPYNITGNFTDKDVEVIRHSMDILENNTCVKYTPLDDQLLSNDIYDGYFVDIINERSGCGASVGRSGGKRSTVNLGPGCVAKYVVMHELLHDIGLHHEQNRPDSEEYIIVHYNNIKPAHQFNFKPKFDLTTYGFQYDYTSIMHYGKSDFRINAGEITIETKDPKYQNVIGHASLPSVIDYQKVCAIYECSECIGMPFVFPTSPTASPTTQSY